MSAICDDDDAQSPSAGWTDAGDDVKEQCIRAILQTLQCFKLRLTPLDIVLEIISASDGKYAGIKTEMLTCHSITRLLNALSECDVLQRDFDDRAMGVALKYVDQETKSIVARIGNHHPHHPILLGHAEIRSEPTVAPFLKAILNQVNASMTTTHRLQENDEVRQEVNFDDSTKSEYSVEDAVEAMLLATSPPPEPSSQESTVVEDDEELVYPQVSTDDVEEEDLTITTHELLPNDSTVSTLDTLEHATIEIKSHRESDAINESPTDTLCNELTQCASKRIGGSELFSPYVPFTTSAIRTSQEEIGEISPGLSDPGSTGPTASGEGTIVTKHDDHSDSDRYLIDSTAPGDNPEEQEDDTKTTTNHSSNPASTESTPRRRKRITEKFVSERNTKVRTRGRRGPFECTLCEARFMQKQSLQDHMNTHTGAKPYQCRDPSCDKRFSHYVTLRLHHLSCHKPQARHKLEGAKDTSIFILNPSSTPTDADDLPDEDTDEVEESSATPTKARRAAATANRKLSDSTSTKQESEASDPLDSGSPEAENQTTSDDDDKDTDERPPSHSLKITIPGMGVRKVEPESDSVAEMAIINNLPRKRKRKDTSEKKPTISTRTRARIRETNRKTKKPAKNSKAPSFPCELCPKTFTRLLGQRDHMNMHTGHKPYVCIHPGCGERFTHYHRCWRHNKKPHDKLVD